MMADQPPPLEATPLLNEVPLLPHMVNGDSIQQVILVQVNPGETFTITTEDGHVQCIQGPAHVPMMSPNGSMPPIFVPPGYVSQVVEENGVRKVVVLPHSAEFHPSMHPPPPPPPPPHVPHYLHHHHALLPPHPHPVYPPVPGTGEMPPQFIHQHPPPHVFQEQEPRSHGRTNFIQRDERSLKMQEHLKKRLKDRQAGGHPNNKLNSPPSSPQKVVNSSSAMIPNGNGKGQQGAGGALKQKQIGKAKGSPDAEMGEEVISVPMMPFPLSRSRIPPVSDIQARSAVLSWNLPVSSQNGESHRHSPAAFTFEVAISNSGKNGKFKSVYVGEELTITLPDLRPATDYHARVSATSSSIKESISELVSFTTESCEPDCPAAPKLINRTKNSLSLQWKSSNDNGSKISNFLLEWDEGRNGPFKECYYGHMKQYKLTKLTPSTRYSLRLAAKNDIGLSGFSETVTYYTAGIVPPAPSPPVLLEAGVSWMALRWSPPSSWVASDDSLTYSLDMEEEGSGYGFQPQYNGEELSCTLRNLRRSTAYKFRLFAYNSEGKSSPSEVVEHSTKPDRPGPPSKPVVKGKIHSHSVRVTWEPPRDNGGSDIAKYFLEISEAAAGGKWDTIYSGAQREHVCDHLRPGTSYRLRVSCASRGGESQASDVLTVTTSAVPPGPCPAPCLAGKAKPKEISLQWGPPAADGGSEVTEYLLEMASSEQEERRAVYQGPAAEYVVSNLLPGRTYCFWIRAGNRVGFGPHSDKAELSTAPGPPDQCCKPLIACKSATCALVCWESPGCNGAEISEYRLDWGQLEGSMHIIYTGPCQSYEVKGLTPATTYYCRVQAVNVAGVGLFGETSMVTTPASVPAAVAVLHLLEEDQLEISPPSSTCLAIQWEEPCCHGAEITGYNIEYGEKQLVTVGRNPMHVLENLLPDTVYRIRIQAINSFGVGPFSHSMKAKTKPLPPDPPHLECVVFSYQSLKLKWGEGPSRALITNPTQFNLQMEDRFGRFVTVYSGPCHTYKVQRLSESTTYSFRIQAYNDAGEGAFSQVYTFTTTKSPPASLKAPKANQLEENTYEITWEPLQPMKGDSIVYILQLAAGREFDQVYKGAEPWFRLPGLQTNCEYRVRVCAGRHDPLSAQELYGPYSPSTVFCCQGQEQGAPCAEPSAQVRGGPALREERVIAVVLLCGFAVVAILFAVIIQYFVIK
ncbi:Fibronectin type-III domain-containing protein 3a [Acanthisitta chloris]|uniref:Fibronectin type-III domain-containing protein 3a n=1 Tax=Acanthisitta chloris TaxID=57068 RepID=A0A091MKE7_9PASS|nr:Fibronectin type-III domain-containing protein 3a [Acanthisitta chloris]